MATDGQHRTPTMDFFKVFLQELSGQHMRFPPAFIRRCNGRLPKKAILRDSYRRCIQVDLETSDDISGFYIKTGWPEFVRVHGIEEGDFLVFEYDEGGVFDVRIYGIHGCRKEKLQATNNKKPKLKSSVKIEDESEEKASAPEKGVDASKLKQKAVELGQETNDNYSGSRREKYNMTRSTNVRREVRKLFEWEGLEPPQNPHFLFASKDTYRVCVPWHLLIHNGIRLEEKVILRAYNGESWPVRVNLFKDGRVCLTTGCRNFAKANNLGRNDRCVFEFMLQKGGICKELRTHIFRGNTIKPRRRCRLNLND